MRGRTAHLCWPCVQRTFIAARLARRGGRCGATWFSFIPAPRRRKKDSGRACAAGPMKWRVRWRWSNARHANWSSSGKTKRLGTTPGTLRRAFVQVTGLRPRELAAALRLARFKKMLREGKGIAEALYETGYGSTSRVYESSNAQLGMTPATYRKGGRDMKIGYAIAKSSLGRVLVGATERGVSAVYLGDAEAKLVEELREEYPKAEITAAGDSFERWVKEIVQRVEGNPPRLELPLDLQATAFQRRVWQELQRIPRGSTRTYTQVARALGSPKSVRAVARACATNPVSIVVPCHRVIREDGSLAGYRWGLSRKEQLLAQERAAS